MDNYITQGTTITVQNAVLKIKIAEYPKIFQDKLSFGTIFAIVETY